MKEGLAFLVSAIRNPRTVSWITPTGRFASKRIARKTASCNEPQTIVELGAGSGAITRALLAKGAMHAESRLAVIELLPELAEFMRRNIHDPRCTVLEGDAAQLDAMLEAEGIREVDAVVSGIPFSQIDPMIAADIARQIDAVLRPGGTVVAYQIRRNVQDVLAPYFPEQTARWLGWNLPPLRLITARRTRENTPAASCDRGDSFSPYDADADQPMNGRTSATTT